MRLLLIIVIIIAGDIMENNELKDFNTACNDFLNGKYILAEGKISTILDTLSKNNKLKDIVAECINGYNFSSAFDDAVGENGIIVLPTDAKGIIAFVFSLLYNIDAKNFDFYDFLTSYYNFDELNNMGSFKMFADNIVLPFKEAINTVYAKTHILVDTDDYQNNISNKLKKICQLNIEVIDDYRLKDVIKEELLCLLNTMITACENNDKKVVYALLIAFEYFCTANKRTRVIYEQLKECFER